MNRRERPKTVELVKSTYQPTKSAAEMRNQMRIWICSGKCAVNGAFGYGPGEHSSALPQHRQRWPSSSNTFSRSSASGESPILTDDSSYRTVVELSATLFHHWFCEARGDHRGVQAAGIRAVENG